MKGDGLVDEYLPVAHWGAVEARLMAKGGSLVAPFHAASAVDSELPLRLFAVPIDHCIRNLTHRFPDGPTYFLLSRSAAFNAMIARFEGYQCIIVAEGVHVKATALFASLLVHEPLRMFLRAGEEPDEPESEPVRSREEALAHLYQKTGEISDEVRSLTTICSYLLIYLLTAHEIGHLALGHLSRRLSGAMDETGETEEPKAESRAQEWDADGFALAGTLYLMGSEFRSQPVWREALHDERAILRLLSFVAYVLFTLMDNAGPQDRDPEHRTHPRPLVRVGLAILTLITVMDQFGSVGGDEVLATTRATVRASEITLQELAGGVMEPALAIRLGEELDGEVQRLTPVLADLWADLDRSRLDGLYWARGLRVQPTPDPLVPV